MTRLHLSLLLGCGLFVLTACEDDASKAERYFQSGLQLIEEGDNERALVELRNVFLHDGFHREARETYAGLVLEMGRTQEAYGQYLRLVEQYPEATDARVILAELAIESGNWDEVERHGTAAFEQAPQRMDVQAIDLVLKYRQANIENETETRAQIAQRAETLLAEIRAGDAGENPALARVAIDHLIQTGQMRPALDAVNATLVRAPEAEDLNLIKAQLLAELGDTAGLGAQLKQMTEIFPENAEIKQSLINWFMAEQDMAGAEAFLRDQAGPDTGETAGHLNVIQMLRTTQGDDAARAEIERLQEANTGTENGRFYGAMLTAFDYADGNTDSAIADMRSIVDASESGAQKNRLRITLAQMLAATGAQGEADALVEEVLSDDPGNVPALQLQAARLIREDRPGEAIGALRRALDQSPRDAETLTLMAQAHQRDGDANLAGERLALAMEATGNAPPQALRYARFLLSQDRPQVARNVLEDVRRRAPDNPQILMMLADIYAREADWTEAEGIVRALRNIDTPATRQAATELQARILQAQNRTAESLQVLETQLSDETDAGALQKIRSIVLIVQTQIRNGKLQAARRTLDTARAENPDNPDLQLLDASLLAVMDETAQAETIYRDLIARFPQSELPTRLLIILLSDTGQQEAAEALLDDALERMPQQADLLWIKASRLENRGDIDGAIAIYEDIYARNSANPVVANNLASLITTHRDDAESLARAANIARRLRGTEVPAFQDTYGWIAYRRGDFEDAVSYLEPAAAGLSDNALVQYHLGMTYAALERREEAITTLGRALELAGDSPLPQFSRAREILQELSNTP